MDEQKLIKRIKADLAMSLLEGYTWYVDEVLALIVSYLYYFPDLTFEKAQDITNKLGSLSEIYKLTRKIVREKPDLKEYTRDSLRMYFRQKWVSTLDTTCKKKLITQSITLINEINQDGSLFFKGNDKVYSKIEEVAPVINITYGDREYLPQIIDEITPEQIELNDDATIIERDLCLAWKEIRDKPDYTELMPYVWKLNVSHQKYRLLKENLKNYLASSDESQRIICEKYAELLFVYIALWYRWEYNGNDGQSVWNELKVQIDVDEVWRNNTNINAELYRYTDDGNRNYNLYSIYVLGGFPLTYIASGNNNRFDRLFREIFSGNNDAEIIASSFDRNNYAYRRSFNEGSFHFYIESLIGDNPYIADEDSNLPNVQCFYRLMKEGQRFPFKDIFKPVWNFYIDSDKEFEDVECSLNVKLVSSKQSLCLSAECINVWNLSPDLTLFFIGLESDNGLKSDNTLRFSRCRYEKIDEFVGWGTTDQLGMRINGDISKIKVVLYADCNRNKYLASVCEIPIENYYQLYATANPYEWRCSGRVDNYTKSGVLFRQDKLGTSPNESPVPKHFIGKSWSWLEMSSNLTLKNLDTDEEIILKISNRKLVIKYKQNVYICYVDKNKSCVNYENENGENEYLVLLLGKKGIQKIQLYPNCEGEVVKNISPTIPNLSIEYQQNGSKWNNFRTEELNPGRIRLKVTYENYSIVENCYYLPDGFVTIDTDRYNINYANLPLSVDVYGPLQGELHLDDEKVKYDCDGNSFVLLQRGENNCYFFCDGKYNSAADYVPFVIKNGNGYLKINVWRARRARELYRFGIKLIGLDARRSNKMEIDYILKDQFELRSVNMDNIFGVKRSEIKHCFFDSSSIPGNEQFVELADNVCIRKYSNSIWKRKDVENNEFSLNVSEKYFKEYKFFIWNFCNPDEDPMLINSLYDSNNRCLTLLVDSGVWNGDGNEGLIIFQSLKGLKPNFYVTPCYRTGWHIPNFKKDDLYLRCYQIACDHGIYFSQFGPIVTLVKDVKQLIVFVRNLIDKHNGLNEVDCINLMRFSDEFIFDWLLLPQCDWRFLIKGDKRSAVDNLFKKTCLARNEYEKGLLNTLIDRYWNFRPRDWLNVRNPLLKFIGNYKKNGKNRYNEDIAVESFETRKANIEGLMNKQGNLIRELINDIERQGNK